MVSRVVSSLAVWSWLIFLLVIHIATNRLAVRAVSLRTLNRQRANLVFSTFFEDGVVLRPEEVSAKERIFERDGVLRWKGSKVLGFGRIGIELRHLLTNPQQQSSSTSAIGCPTVVLKDLAELYAAEQYLLWYDENLRTVLIVLKDQASTVSQLQSWAHGLLLVRHLAERPPTLREVKIDITDALKALRSTLVEVKHGFGGLVSRLEDVGWDLKTASLETRSGCRVHLQLRS